MNGRTFVLAVALTAFAPSVFSQSLTGAGATFPALVYTKWFDEFHKLHPGVQINYSGGGSGAGIKQITDGTVDFGASDAPMTGEEMTAFRAKRNRGVLHFPTVIGAVVPIYSIPGVSTELNFTGEALAGIYLGMVTKWNDPAIASVNPKVKLPDANIIVVHRSDASGTSFAFTDYLSKVSPEWKSKVGVSKSPAWPTGLGAKDSAGVAAQVKFTRFSIGYVDLVYADQTSATYGSVKNKSGVFVKAGLKSANESAAGVAIPDDFRVSITDPAGKASYPISTFTWLLIPDKIDDPKKKKALTDFLAWMLVAGDSSAVLLDFAPLPKALVEREKRAIAKIQ